MKAHPNYRVSVEIIILHNNAVLLTKRSCHNAIAPDTWSVPSGKVKYDEIPVAALFREAKEETNLDVEFVRELSVRTFCYETPTEPHYRLMYSYLAKLKTGDPSRVTLNEEHSEFCWVTKDLLAAPKFSSLVPNLREIIRSILESVQ